MESVRKLYRVFNLVSLDIAAGAVVSALFFAKLLGTNILPYGLIALALTVWIVYTADHLRDARAIKHHASSERHHFHQRHFKFLFLLMCGAILVNVIIIFFIRKQVLEAGLILALVVAAYLVVQRYLKVFKEFFVACLYTCGVLLPSLSVVTQPPTTLQYAMMIQFAMIAFLNLLMFSWFDHDHDVTDRQSSFATILGKAVASKWILIIAILNVLFGVVIIMLSAAHVIPAIILILMNVLLVMIFVSSKGSKDFMKYRLLGDAIFLLPVIYLWLP
jgi:hypothetical protein